MAAAILVSCSQSPGRPIASAEGPSSAAVGELVRLDGSGSTDPTGSALSFQWGLVATPPGSRAALQDPTLTFPWFLPDRPGEYRARLVVSTLHASSEAVEFAIEVSPQAPLALVEDSFVHPGALAELDGSGSRSPGGAPLSYQWKVTDPMGQQVALLNPSTSRPSFRAERLGLYPVELTVHDGTSPSHPAQASIYVSFDLERPVAHAGLDGQVKPGGTVTLGGADSYTTNQLPGGAGLRPLAYQWTLVTRPSGSTAVLQSPSSVNPSFTADLPGLFRVRLTVEDGLLESAPDYVEFTAVDSNRPPQANAGPGLEASTGSQVTLNGSGSFDPDGQSLTFAWTLVSRPSGSSAALAGGDTATPTFTADRAGTFALKLVVTDPDGAQSAPCTTLVRVENGAPQAVIAGAGPLVGLVGQALTLDGSFSSDPDGDLLSYQWAITSAPAGATATLGSPQGALTTLGGSKPGSYVVLLRVSDGSSVTGSASRTVLLEGASTLQAVSGQAQSGTVGGVLAAPLVVKALSSSGSPVPGASLQWRIHGGTLANPPALTNAAGEACAYLSLSRMAGPGAVKVWLTGQPNTALTFNFTAAPDQVSSLAVSAAVGSAATGAVVSVRTVDRFGNFATSAATASAAFALSTTSPSSMMRFDTLASKGKLVSPGATQNIEAELVNGEFEILLKDPIAENINLTLKASLSGSSPAPFSAWVPAVFESAETGLTGWTVLGNAPRWAVVSGQSHAGSRSVGIELSAVDPLSPATSQLARSLAALPPHQMAKLSLMHRVSSAMAWDPGSACTAGPRFYVSMRTALTASAPEKELSPSGGYSVLDGCFGGQTFQSATPAWSAATFELTEALAAGFTGLFFNLTSTPTAATLAQPASWHLDNLLVSYHSMPGMSAQTVVSMLPGQAKVVEFSSQTYGGLPLVLGQCLSGRSPFQITATLKDAAGNRTQDSDVVYQIGWTGNPYVSAITTGEMKSTGVNHLELRFENGQATFQLSSKYDQTSTLTLIDTRGTGITPGPAASANLRTYFCHSNGGFGSTWWSDFTAPTVFDATQALRACESYYGSGNCASGANDAYPAGPSCGLVLYRWAHATHDAATACGQVSLEAKKVSTFYWSEGACGTSCGTAGGTFSVATANGWPWQ